MIKRCTNTNQCVGTPFLCNPTMSNKPVFTPKNISYLSTYSYQCNLSKLITYVNNASPACLDNC